MQAAVERRTAVGRRMKMIKDNNPPQEQSAKEETHPESLDHDDLEASEAEKVSGGVPHEHAGTGDYC
jgi:hypothetical protein